MKNGSHHHLLLGLYITGTVCFLLHALIVRPEIWISWPLLLGGFVIGVGTAWGNLLFMKALDVGPASLTSPLSNANIVIIIFASVFIYGESLGVFEIIGILLLLAAVVLISVRKEPLTINEKKWFVLVALLIILFTFRNGGLKVTSELGLSSTLILFWGYLMSVIWFAGSSYRLTRQANPPTQQQKRIALIWGLLAGLMSYVGMQLYAVALEIGKANVVAPIFATHSLVVAIGAILIFHERLTWPQKISFVCLIIGLVIIRI